MNVTTKVVSHDDEAETLEKKPTILAMDKQDRVSPSFWSASGLLVFCSLGASEQHLFRNITYISSRANQPGSLQHMDKKLWRLESGCMASLPTWRYYDPARWQLSN
jgi:hypothetical protein